MGRGTSIGIVGCLGPAPTGSNAITDQPVGLTLGGLPQNRHVAPNLACGEARGVSIPPKRGCDRRATKPQAKFGATRRAAGLFRPAFVARSLQTHFGVCS